MKHMNEASIFKQGLEFCEKQLQKGLKLFCPLLKTERRIELTYGGSEDEEEEEEVEVDGGERNEEEMMEEMEEMDLTFENIHNVGIDLMDFQRNDCVTVKREKVYSILLPYGFSQGTLNGRNGSAACTVISLLTGYFFTRFTTHVEDFQQLVSLYLGCMEVGNSKYRNGELLSVNEALDYLPSLSMDIVEETNCSIEGLSAAIESIVNSQFLVITSQARSVCIIRNPERFILFDSHQTKEAGALILSCPINGIDVLSENIIADKNDIICVNYIKVFW